MSTNDENPAPPDDENAARAATNWAKAVSKLTVSDAPEGATNLNVEGRRLTSPIQGFGRMWQKTYQVRLPKERVTANALIDTWKRHFPDFWPGGSRFYGPLTGIQPGDVALLNLKMPARVKLSTGVMVLYADEESFTFMTPEGHMFAGWITFSGTEHGDETVAQVQILMRASDPLFEVALSLGGQKMEDRFWSQTLQNLAAYFDAPTDGVVIQSVCVDRKRQWSRWRNLWHSSAVRSALYMAAHPRAGRGQRRQQAETPETPAATERRPGVG